jgi:hypothetical protein
LLRGNHSVLLEVDSEVEEEEEALPEGVLEDSGVEEAVEEEVVEEKEIGSVPTMNATTTTLHGEPHVIDVKNQSLKDSMDREWEVEDMIEVVEVVTVTETEDSEEVEEEVL